MDGAGGHYLYQTNPRTGNQILHVLTYKWKLNYENTWTYRGTPHTGAYQRVEGEAGRGSGKITNRY